MDACKKYLDKATDLIRLLKSGQKETKEVKDLEKECTSYWKQMTEEERCYADEQVIRIGQWLKD